MKIFLSIFAVSITVFFFFSLSVACSWIFYLSATIHKNYIFLFCNSILVFISLNSQSSVSPEKDHGRELARRKQPAVYCDSGSLNRSRTVGEVGTKKEMGLLPVVQVREDWNLTAGDDDEKADEAISDVVEETYGDDYDEEVAGDDKTLPDNVEQTRDDELEAVETQDDGLEVVEDDKILSVVEGTHDDELEVVKNDKTLSVVEETQDGEPEMEGDKRPLVVEKTQDDNTCSVVEEIQDDELEAMEDDKTRSVVEETQDDDEQEQGGSIDTISLEELHRKCEEFIRRMKQDIRVESLSVPCY